MGTLAYALFGNQILYIFTDKADVIEVAKSVLFWTILAPVVSSFCYIFDGIYIGATETAPMRNTMILATFLVFIPTYYGATYLFGKHGLWLAMVLFMITRGVALGIYLPKTILKT
jgi:MATE family multidrug resistance protein